MSTMRVSDFDYDLPESFIAQTPVEPRDSSRLMVIDRASDTLEHRHFRDLVELVDAGDVLVLNSTRVIPARLHATKTDSGGAVELLLLRKLDDIHWRALVGGRRLNAGTRLSFADSELTAEVAEVLEESERIIAFSAPVEPYLEALGEMPLPPYIHQRASDPERYQTVYSRQVGSAAAPTAGLHFTPELLLALRDKGVQFAYCTLHIGLDTFQPVRVEDVESHHIHSERASLTTENARIINDAKLAGGRIIAVGTTAARTLETAGILSAGGDPADPAALGDACPWKPVVAFEADTNLFIYPGYRWRVLDGIVTNFHLPRSTLLMMISAFVGREKLMAAYEEAKRQGYRFFSFGDAMLIQ